MKDQHDLFWNAVVAAETPSAEEMAQAEAGLREIERAEPAPQALSQAQIDAMVAAAVRPEVIAGGAPRRTGLRRLVAIAAVLFLSLSVAAVWVIWEGTHAPDTLDYAEAIQVASEPIWVEEHKLQALAIIQRDCGPAFQAIRKLCDDDLVPSLRDEARRIRDKVITLLTQGADRMPGAADLRLATVINESLNNNLTPEQRQQSFAHLGHLCVQGMRAFAAADLRTVEANEKREYWRKRLLRKLAQ